MTNKEWLKTLSDKELSDWLTDLSNGKFYPADFCMDFVPMPERTGHAQNAMPMEILTVNFLYRTSSFNG